jgi:leucyl aminopeptidase
MLASRLAASLRYFDLPEWGFVELFLIGIGKKSEFTPSHFQETVATSLRKMSGFKIQKATIFLLDRYGMDAFSLGYLLSEALYLSQYKFNKYVSDKEDLPKKVAELDVLLHPLENQSPKDFEKEYAQLQEGAGVAKQICKGVFLARDLVNEPAVHLNPSQIAAEAKKISAHSNGTISVKVLDRAECEKLGMGCFLAVAKGSDTEPEFVILHYKGDRGDARGKGNMGNKVNMKKIVLIGKTIIFDSGGLSIKPPKAMETMKLDMAGGAAVLGLFSILGKLGKSGKSGQLGVEVYGILPACENMISGKATRPGDIAIALNGKSVEILNTDAEGRLALADALSYTEKYIKPDYIIDLATLTGAIMVALGDDIAGLFANDDMLAQQLKSAGEKEGELSWHMPLHKDYHKKMKSQIADLKNISSSSYGGAITAAVFLNEFVKKAKWAHIDIAAVAYNEGSEKGITPVGATGWGVKTIYRWLSDNFN